MAEFFTIGETKKRPNVYFRYENSGTPPLAGASDGVCACVISTNWGELNKPTLIESSNDLKIKFGTEGGVDVPFEMLKGGAKSVYVVRAGDPNGICGSLELKDKEGKKIAELKLLSPSSRKFKCIIQENATDEEAKDIIIFGGGEELERITFRKSCAGNEDEVANLLSELAVEESRYFTITSAENGGIFGNINEEITGGAISPEVTIGNYETALEALNGYRWNVIGVDSNDSALHSYLAFYLDERYKEGNLVMGVVGEPASVDFATRLQNSTSFNNFKMVYVGSGFKDSNGNVYEGYLAAARIAGMIAGTPSDSGITHSVITGAVSLTEVLPNVKQIEAIEKGMLTFSTSAKGQHWVECGINTLVAPSTNEDEGWKKIKRTKVRYELLQRINDTVEGLIGKINNDSDGRANITQAAQGVINKMIAEKKLLSGAKITEDAANLPAGDSAWFIIQADDIDSVEKMYFAFKFRFSPNV